MLQSCTRGRVSEDPKGKAHSRALSHVQMHTHTALSQLQPICREHSQPCIPQERQPALLTATVNLLEQLEEAEHTED